MRKVFDDTALRSVVVDEGIVEKGNEQIEQNANSFQDASSVTKLYKETSLTTMDTGRLILICYDSALEYLNMALFGIENRKYEKKYEGLTKAFKAIAVLLDSLDYNQGGDVAQNLDTFYRYILKKILDIDISKNKEELKKIIEYVTIMRDAWKEALGKKEGNSNGGEKTTDK